MYISSGTRHKQLIIVVAYLRVGTDWADRTRSRKDTFPVNCYAFGSLNPVNVFLIQQF